MELKYEFVRKPIRTRFDLEEFLNKKLEEGCMLVDIALEYQGRNFANPEAAFCLFAKIPEEEEEHTET